MKTLQKTRQTTSLGAWEGQKEDLISDPAGIQECLRDLTSPVFLLQTEKGISAAREGIFLPGERSRNGHAVAAYVRPQKPADFGSPEFLSFHQVQSPYMAGSMANGISGEELVIAMGNAGYLASFGAGGVSPQKLKMAVTLLKKQLAGKPYAFNLLHSPHEPEMEQHAVDLYLAEGITTIEASAFLRLTPPLVQYRAAGLQRDARGNLQITNKVIAKLSRREVADHFLHPAPEKILRSLVSQGKLTSQQAQLAALVPMADDITVEADSGGHTDNRPLTSLLPSIKALRNEADMARENTFEVRIGAAGGISTPTSILGAFAMGADYVVTGSINQSCREAGTSDRVKALLAEAETTDVMMAPSADMFEMGVKVQVLKRGSMFPLRAQKLYEIYRGYESIEALETPLRRELEEKYFQQEFEQVWAECIEFFSERDPSQLERAQGNPKRKMGLIFRWYLGLATHWGIQGDPDRAYDYQIWCGPSMGAFNDWTRGTRLAEPENRHVVAVADQLMAGAAYLHRLADLRLQGFSVPTHWQQCIT